MFNYKLWRVVHRLHSASWWLLLEEKEGVGKTPGDLWKAVVMEQRITTQTLLPEPLSNSCYRVRRKLLQDLEACGVQYVSENVG
jgi:hypothetical protein